MSDKLINAIAETHVALDRAIRIAYQDQHRFKYELREMRRIRRNLEGLVRGIDQQESAQDFYEAKINGIFS